MMFVLVSRGGGQTGNSKGRLEGLKGDVSRCLVKKKRIPDLNDLLLFNGASCTLAQLP